MKPSRPSRSVVASAMLNGSPPKARAQDETGAPPYRNPSLPVEQRVEDLLARMSLEEKVDLLSGTGYDSKPNARLGIPALRMADGPQGVRLDDSDTDHPSKRAPKKSAIAATAFPCGVSLAATWNPQLVQQVGRAIAREARMLNKDMLLAPCVNIVRVPHGGRNFESFGEDPFLASQMAVTYIHGVQSQGVIATVKHFAANNQEFERRTINAKIDERVLHEIYFPAFRAAVQEAGVWSVMSAYNKVNGAWCSENPYLLTDVLKRQWGFQGFVVSDWGAVHSTVATAKAGLDIEMPTGKFLNGQLLLPPISDGQVSQAIIDDKVRRILRAMFSVGLFDQPESQALPFDISEHRSVARTAAAEGIVLLKNVGGLLPLLPKRVRSMAVLGPNAAEAYVGGGGSAMVTPVGAVSPLDGIRSRAGSSFDVVYAPGCAMADEKENTGIASSRADLLNEAVAVAAKVDVVVVFVGDSAHHESEGYDRQSLELPAGQDELIEAVAKTNPNTIVVLGVGAPVLMGHWIDRVPAVLNAWLGGQEVGNAIAAVLFGDVNPSGKLPVTFLKDWKDSPAYGRYPGAKGMVDYEEGLYVGYRHFDKENIEPLFAFGHGLSYTTFEYSDLKVSPEKVAPNQTVQICLNVRNTGSREGAEAVQVYVRDVKSSVERPVKELKAFRKITLKPGETRPVSFTLDKSAMAFYDVAKQDWIAEPGTFEVAVGASSRDIRLKAKFELTK